MTRYKQAYQEMYSQNKELFDNFKKVHDGYTKDQEFFQFRFNKIGRRVLEAVHEHENKLCGKTERGVYNKFSGNLSEKFRQEVKKAFPKIDFVGVRVS